MTPANAPEHPVARDESAPHWTPVTLGPDVPPPKGAYSPGVRAGDLIVSIDGRPIAGVGDLQRSLVGDLVGRPVEVTLERDGTMAEIVLTPAELRT